MWKAGKSGRKLARCRIGNQVFVVEVVVDFFLLGF